ncbi:methylamine utilization protein MauE [Streptomyces sp. ML-6]|nr:MauE/DoxX family redox-associated membrane protein [Streptomyces sp. ML-6]MDK0518196.1 methylamine utilization protein MauE [Streptomyces sp. ML-6]
MVVFAAAAVGKVRTAAAFSGFCRSLKAMGLVPDGWVRVCGAAVVISEVSVVLLLLATPLGDWAGSAGFVLAACLLAVFTIGLARALTGRRQAVCRCFGASEYPLGARHIVRNIVLWMIALCGVAAHSAAGHLRPAEALLAACSGVLVGALAVVSDDLVQLFRPIRR